MSNPNNKAIEKRSITALIPHPRQPSLFAEPSAQEVQDLAADMKKNGLLNPVEILQDGTIIAGTKRGAAPKHPGWTEIEVWVRDDLAAQGNGAVERRLIEDNLYRQQLGPIEIARAYLALKKLGRPWGLSGQDRVELRDQIGKRLDMSGRNLDRYLRVLDTPIEVQNAVAANKLPVTVAEKVAGLHYTKREQIAAEIRAGANPRAVARKYVPKPG